MVTDRGGQKVKKGECHEGLLWGCAGGCPIRPEQGHPAGSLRQQMASPASAALSRAQVAAGDSGQLPKPGSFGSETQASICKVSHWHMSQTGWQVDFEHQLGEEQAATTMSRGCSQKRLLCSASLCSYGAGFV